MPSLDIRNNDCLIGWHGHTTNVIDVKFNPGETCIFSIDSNGKVRLFLIYYLFISVMRFLQIKIFLTICLNVWNHGPFVIMVCKESYMLYLFQLSTFWIFVVEEVCITRCCVVFSYLYGISIKSVQRLLSFHCTLGALASTITTSTIHQKEATTKWLPLTYWLMIPTVVICWRVLRVGSWFIRYFPFYINK